MRIRCVILVVALVFPAAQDAFAQGFPRRERTGPAGAPRETGDAGKRAASVPPAPSDPMAAVERELPSLKVDLKLSAEQLGAWSAFERDVRDVAEMGRVRRRHVMALGTAPEGTSALTLIQTVAEDDRMRAEAMADLRSHLQALYAALADDQRRLLDRRVTQSQSDPLGR